MKFDWNPRPSKVFDANEVESTWQVLSLAEEIDLSHIGAIIDLWTPACNLGCFLCLELVTVAHYAIWCNRSRLPLP